MSDTRRWTMPGWGLGDSWFRQIFPNIKSDKHQKRDRESGRRKANHRKSFRSGDTRSRYQLTQDQEQQDLKEMLQDEDNTG
jgi:hypothetical protein